MKKKLLTLLLPHFLTFSFACECPPLEPFSVKQCEEYETIFYGRVDSTSISGEKCIAYFNISELYKGVSEQQAKIYFDCTSSCQMNFAKNELWIIYAEYKRFGEPKVSFCSRSRKYFPSSTEDYYEATHKLKFIEELELLQKNIGVKQINKSITSNEAAQRELIKPGGMNMLWLLVCSMGVLLLIYFILKKRNK